MSINVTPIPRLIDLAAPAFTLGTANAAGSAVTAVASDSTLLAFDATVPTTIAYSASAAPGSAVVTSRRDHTHGMAAEPAIPSGVMQVFCNITAAGAADGSIGVSSVTDSGTGDFSINYSVTFSGTNAYAGMFTMGEMASTVVATGDYFNRDGFGASVVAIVTKNSSGSAKDIGGTFAGFGALA